MTSLDRVRELLHYNPETGRFTWLERRGYKATAGVEAGCINVHGYRTIGIDNVDYYAHRLAWLYVTGRWPSKHIDHRNADRGDNRFSNLREADDCKNTANSRRGAGNTSGFKGVGWHSQQNKWRAYIMFRGKYIHLGLFTTPEAASAAYAAKACELFGEFARVG